VGENILGGAVSHRGGCFFSLPRFLFLFLASPPEKNLRLTVVAQLGPLGRLLIDFPSTPPFCLGLFVFARLFGSPSVLRGLLKAGHPVLGIESPSAAGPFFFMRAV